MPTNVYSLRAHAVENLLAVKRPDIPLRVVARNTAAVVLPLLAGLATGHLQAGLGVAAGALNTMFSDQPGPYRQRLRQLLLATFAAGLAALLGFLIGGQLLPLMLITAAFGFFGGLLVVFGADTARVGMTSIILLVITAATPTSLHDAFLASALIVAGGLLLTMFSLAAWPWQRYWPERQALAAVYTGLAALAQQQVQEDNDAPALTDVMTTVQRTLLGEHRAHGRAMEAFRVLLELAERMRLELTAMTELGAMQAATASVQANVAQVLNAIAEALTHGAAPEHAARALLSLQQSEKTLLAGHHVVDNAVAHIHALAGQLAAAVRNADWAGGRGELRASAAEVQLPQALRSNAGWATLRANLTPRSVAFRHAVRTAASLCVALLVANVLRLPHGYWLPMTVAIVLRSDFAATFKFGLLRVLGTVLGLVLTTVLLHITPNEPWAHLALMAVLCMTFRYLATAHYGVAVAALTGTVVILLSFDGVDPGSAVLDRAINTALGCGMALLAYVAWPTWERGRARAALATMLDAYANYLRALVQPGRRDTRNETRTAARTARSNAQASIERMRTEPATPPELLAFARSLFANGNRLARSAMTLEALLDDLAALPAEAGMQPLIADFADALQAMAASLRDPSIMLTVPTLRARQRASMTQLDNAQHEQSSELWARISDRLVDNVDTLAHIIGRSQQASVEMSAVHALPPARRDSAS